MDDINLKGLDLFALLPCLLKVPIEMDDISKTWDESSSNSNLKDSDGNFFIIAANILVMAAVKMKHQL